jgi:cobalt-zinc-cadmium efflux system protein
MAGGVPVVRHSIHRWSIVSDGPWRPERQQYYKGVAHPHAHGHVDAGHVSDTTMAWAVGVTTAFVAAEAIAGWVGDSLALLSDAGHNLADAAALALSWYALRVAARPSHDRMTFGYHRVGIFAAFVNAVSLVVIAVVIAWESIDRLRHPAPASSSLMIGVALVAVAMNVAIGLRLQRAAERDINVRSAYIHMLGDALSAAAVVTAGVIVAVTGHTIADPIVSLIIATLIVYSTYEVFRDSTTVLLEGTPADIDMPAVVAAIKSAGGVLDVHDLHVWTVGPGVIACSCHIVVAEQSVREGQQVLRRVVDGLEHAFPISHTTIQVEVEGCAADDMYCTAATSGRHAH